MYKTKIRLENTCIKMDLFLNIPLCILKADMKSYTTGNGSYICSSEPFSKTMY